MSVRKVWAEVDLGAVTANAGLLRSLAGPGTELCAVVKAFGYGHGPVRVAEAALAGGATWLGVALVEEGEALRRAGITEPVLVLSEPRATAMAAVVQADLRPAVYTLGGVEAAARAAAGLPRPLAVHLKVDTGMHRVGADPATALAVAEAVTAAPSLELEGVWTHFAVADERAGASFTATQLRRFHEVVDALAGRGIRPRLLHAANSAGTLTHPDARLDLVRCGIAVYGLAPSPELAGCAPLRPALSLKAEVTHVKVVRAGEGVSYGLRWVAPADTVVATVPIGYADGVPRRYGLCGGEVLIGGRRHGVAGTVTMDQLLVDCGPDGDVEVGDEVVLLGEQGSEVVNAWEWADRLGTIAYEVVCGLSARVPRIYR